jgi:hypothetical protein
MPADRDGANRDYDRGSLSIVGTGIQAISQMTAESLGIIASADIVFFHATNGITASQIFQLNPNAVDLYQYYGNGKNRSLTYVQMAELMLSEVRRGQRVVGVFHGHPGYFVSPARRALAIAASEGYRTNLFAGVSAPDCLFADLRVDPGVRGCQILMASYLLKPKNVVATSGHVVLLQVNAVGDSGFSFSGSRSSRFPELIERLAALYGNEHDCIYYMASVYPGCTPEIHRRPLAEYRDPRIAATVGAGMFYLPPRDMSLHELQRLQAFGGRDPYGPLEQQAVEGLVHHEVPAGYLKRQASPAMLAAMSELGTDPLIRERYEHAPREVVARYPDLSPDERAALTRHTVPAIRSVTTQRVE